MIEAPILVSVPAKKDSSMMEPRFANVINYKYILECAYNCIDCALNPTNCTICNNNPAFSRINLIPSCVCQDGYYDDGI